MLGGFGVEKRGAIAAIHFRIQPENAAGVDFAHVFVLAREVIDELSCTGVERAGHDEVSQAAQGLVFARREILGRILAFGFLESDSFMRVLRGFERDRCRGTQAKLTQRVAPREIAGLIRHCLFSSPR